jgi:sigma-B regulation protein RsbU (phosphoserine phosphatase)
MISASAGHCPLLFCGTGSEKINPGRAGYPLGIEAGAAYAQTVNALPPGAAALLYTDGLSEARNAAGELLGEKKLAQLFAEAAAKEPDAAGAKNFLLARLAEYRGHAALTDDQTFVLIRHQP